MITRERAVEIAAQWHSVMTWNDPGVMMYALSSTGKVQSEDHRTKLLAYIDDDCQPKAEKMGFMPSHNADEELEDLREYVLNAPIEPIELDQRQWYHLAAKYYDDLPMRR